MRSRSCQAVAPLGERRVAHGRGIPIVPALIESENAIQQLAAQAVLDLVQRREADALTRMKEAAAREDATEKSAVTPGPLAPARELLGDMLMALKRPAEAAAEYRAALRIEPNRRHLVRALNTSR